MNSLIIKFVTNIIDLSEPPEFYWFNRIYFVKFEQHSFIRKNTNKNTNDTIQTYKICSLESNLFESIADMNQL